tara:strand:- start:170 stop:658 length:489 start_codon:yes stop_codon:yes gene_type:complete
MHKIIRSIVYADSENKALSSARGVFDRLTEGQRPFDYYDMFNNGGTSHWGRKYPAVARLDSRTGKRMVVDGWKFTIREMRQHLNRIRKMIDSCKVSELLNDDPMLQYDFFSIGDYNGASCWLYDDDGQGIKNRDHLNNTLNKWNDDELKGLDVYIVPADVHY